jgi:hypothetical protein
MLLFCLGLALVFLAGTVQRAERLREARLRDEALFALGQVADAARAPRGELIGGDRHSWEYADESDRREMLSGGAPCSADEFVAVLVEAGLSADDSAVPLRRRVPGLA